MAESHKPYVISVKKLQKKAEEITLRKQILPGQI